jgi:hypothetical protein
MLDYETWLDSLTDEDLEEAYMIGGGKDDISLMRAYHIQMSEAIENQWQEEKDIEAFEKTIDETIDGQS